MLLSVDNGTADDGDASGHVRLEGVLRAACTGVDVIEANVIRAADLLGQPCTAAGYHRPPQLAEGGRSCAAELSALVAVLTTPSGVPAACNM